MGLVIACTLFGMLCGNLGAVVVKPFNLGLFWNSLIGGIGGIAVGFLPVLLGQDLLKQWYADLLASGAAGMALMLIIGGLVALRYRG